MPNVSSISVLDGKQTPTTHIFTASHVDNGRFLFVDNAPDLLTGRDNVYVSIPPVKAGANQNVEVGFRLNVLGTAVVGGVTRQVVVGSSTWKLTGSLGQGLLLPDRMDHITLVTGFLGHSQVRTAIAQSDPFSRA